MKKLISVVLCIALSFSILVSIGTTASASGEQCVKDGLYTLKNVSSGYMLNVYAGKDANGTKVTTWEYDGTTDQRIYIQHKGNGKYLLKFNASSGGRVIDVNRGESLTASIDDGDKIDIWTANDLDAQYFYIKPCGDGAYIFELASKPNHVISAISSSAAASNGTQLQLKNYSGAAYQKWYICNTSGSKINVCNHLNTSKNVISSACQQADSSQHNVVTDYNISCNDCGETVKSNQQESKSENHSIIDNKCGKCGYKVIGEETSKCKHENVAKHSSESKETTITVKNDSEHTINSYYSLYCTDCHTHVQENLTESVHESHEFVNNVCTKCNFTKIVNKPAATTLKVSKTNFTPGESISLSWDKAAGASSYDIHINKDGQSTRYRLDSGFEGTSGTLKINDEGTYKLTVYSINSAGYTPGSTVTVIVKKAVTEKTGYVYNTEGSNLNMRSQATKNSSIVTKMPEGSSLVVTGNATNGFYPVKFGKYSGYASAEYITFTKPVASSNIASSLGKRIANVYSYPKGTSWIGECVWYVRGRAAEKLGVNTGITGNGCQWYAGAKARGISTGWAVKSNSIACFGATKNNSYGHVIFVEEVVGNQVYYTEANVEKPYSDGKISPLDGVLKVKSVSAFTSGSYQGCIYLK